MRTSLATVLVFAAVAASPACSSMHRRGEYLKVAPGQVAIVTRLEGRPLPAGAWIAPKTAPGEAPYQGLQQDVLQPGHYPDLTSDAWSWELVPQVQIPSDSVGVLVRLFGDDLPEGQVLADENPADEAAGIVRHGILGRTLEPGTHSINTRAYDVQITPKTTIESGQIGVVAQLVGPRPKDMSGLLAEDGERGVQKTVLPPGSHYLNPYATAVVPLSRQSQRIDLTAPGRRVRFPTQDGFDIQLNGTLEWSLADESMPLVYVRFGNLEEVQERLLLPLLRSISRQHGVRSSVRDFIVGQSRLTFQQELERGMKATVEAEGPTVQSLTISSITPPSQISDVIQKRVAADLTQTQYQNQMKTAATQVELARQLALQQRPEALAKAQAAVDAFETKAQQKLAAAQAETAQQKQLVELQLEAAKLEADAIRTQAKGDAEVARLAHAAESAKLKALATAHGGGMELARKEFIEQLAPRYSSVLANTESGLGALLSQYVGLAAGPQPAPPAAPAEPAEEVKK